MKLGLWTGLFITLCSAAWMVYKEIFSKRDTAEGSVNDPAEVPLNPAFDRGNRCQ